jgi:hypothetical protein
MTAWALRYALTAVVGDWSSTARPVWAEGPERRRPGEDDSLLKAAMSMRRRWCRRGTNRLKAYGGHGTVKVVVEDRLNSRGGKECEGFAGGRALASAPSGMVGCFLRPTTDD